MFRMADLINGIRKASTVAAAGVALGSMACGSDPAGPATEADLIGTHEMVTINSHNVPHTFTDAAGSQLTIFGGSLVLYADGTFELAYQGKLNSNDFDLGDEGTYVISGATVTFESVYDEVYTASALGDTVSFSRKIAGVMFTMAFSVE